MQSNNGSTMKKFCLITLSFFCIITIQAQDIQANIQKAYKAFENDPQLKFALASLYIIDAGTGKVIFDNNSRVGMAPASTQKIITSASAFALLGAGYRYETNFYNAITIKPPYENDLLVIGSGDPTLGSWRYNSTKENVIFDKLSRAITQKGIKEFSGNLVINDFVIDLEGIPDGYNWGDIGNYYGAAHFRLNWRENQYDIAFKTGERGPSEIVSVTPSIPGVHFSNLVLAGPKGSGDNAYIYYIPATDKILVKGTVPPNEKAFTISGAVPDASKFFATHFINYLSKPGISITKGYQPKKLGNLENALEDLSPYKLEPLYKHVSPALDSISYWFMKKSVNLYGEALVKSIALEQKQKPTIKNGIKKIIDFWKSKGIEADELNMYDGSGLSPSNRVTTRAQVEILKYARQQPWFKSYLNGFPEYNGMKMKSGTIADVKGFAGYHTATNGETYIFSFLVNNYSGSASALVQKMYKVLNTLK